jgi:hypothetical protein
VLEFLVLDAKSYSPSFVGTSMKDYRPPKICRGSVADFEAWAIKEVKRRHGKKSLFGTTEETRTFEELLQKAKFVDSQSEGTVVYWSNPWYSSSFQPE